MKKSLSSLFIAVILSVTVASVHAAEAASDAVVLALKGNVQVTLPGKAAPTEIKVGDRLPQGTKIVTAAGSELELQAFSGSSTIITEGSKVELTKLSLTTSEGVITKQTATLNLSVGSVISSLDPAKKAINDYSIRTPKGVAAARGTKYVVTVGVSGNVTTYVSTGVVTFFNPVTNQTVDVLPGYVVVVDEKGNISEPVKATKEQSEAAREQRKEDKKAGYDDKTPVEIIDPTVVSASSI
jgi:hypothetical protein